MKIFGFFLLSCFSQFLWALPEDSIKADHVRIDWIAPKAMAPKQTIGVRFKIDPEWHVYWKNPGDSGAAPKFKFTSNSGVEVGPVLWPSPHRLPIAHLTNLGYSDEVVYLFDVTSSVESVDLTLNLEWLVCKEDCIPGFGVLKLSRPVSQNAKPDFEIAKYLAKIPSDGQSSNLKPSAQLTPDGMLKLIVYSESEPNAFPVDGNFLSPGQPQIVRAGGAYEMTFAVAPGAVAPETTGFVVVADGKPFEFSSVSVAPASSVENAADASLFVLLLSAFLGGVILNLMPCVLPVLSIKVLSLVKSGDGRHLKDALLYSAGVLLTFSVLGGAFLILRSAGSSVGWGFHLQSPAVVLILIVLFWLMALNFLGVFEFGTAAMNWAGRFHESSSFATGVLSVFVAAPCTGPFMGTALGAASTLNSVSALGIFLSLGAGLAAPFVVLAMSPALVRRIPKPGVWMERLKQFFAFPLFATVIWLLWVLSFQTGTQGWVTALTFILVLSFCFWLAKSPRKTMTYAAWILSLIVGVVTFDSVTKAQIIQESAPASNSWQPYNKEVIAATRAKGQAVFIDFTAAWCITCQVNKKVVLDTSAAQEIFKRNNVYLVRADWTQQNPEITAALAEFGRNSVPVYVFYPADGAATQVLPQMLSLSIIENLFEPTKGNEK